MQSSTQSTVFCTQGQVEIIKAAVETANLRSFSIEVSAAAYILSTIPHSINVDENLIFMISDFFFSG